MYQLVSVVLPEYSCASLSHTPLFSELDANGDVVLPGITSLKAGRNAPYAITRIQAARHADAEQPYGIFDRDLNSCDNLLVATLHLLWYDAHPWRPPAGYREKLSEQIYY